MKQQNISQFTKLKKRKRITGMKEKIASAINDDYLTTITILENISDAIFILDASGKIEYINKIAQEILQTESNRIVGKSICDFIVLEDSMNECDRYDLIRNINQGVYNEFETNLINKNIKTPVILSFGIIRNNLNEIKYIIVSAKDITIKKQLEKELKEKQHVIITQDKLKSLGELAISLVHEITQPLSSMKLNIEHIEKMSGRPGIEQSILKEKLGQLSKLVNIIAESVDRTRNFAFQVENHSLQLINIKDSIKNALHQTDYELKNKNIQVKLNYKKNIPYILANQISLEQVFILIIKYCFHTVEGRYNPDRITRLTIDLTTFQNKWVEIQISNNLKDINLPVLHERIDSRMKHNLTTIRSIITNIGGDISVSYNKNRGTIFFIRIPLAQQEERSQLFSLIELLHPIH